MAQQFQNQPLIELLRPYDRPVEAKTAYFQALLEKVAPATTPGEAEAQRLADELVATIEGGLRSVTAGDPQALEATLKRLRELIEVENADVNRLGGALRQPALIVVVTGNNGDPANPDLAEFRKRVADYLLDNGADPRRLEHHPMGVHAIIRAAVFNHLDILRAMGQTMRPEDLTAALNDVPIVNGLTALHDSVLRALHGGT